MVANLRTFDLQNARVEVIDLVDFARRSPLQSRSLKTPLPSIVLPGWNWRM